MSSDKNFMLSGVERHESIFAQAARRCLEQHITMYTNLLLQMPSTDFSDLCQQYIRDHWGETPSPLQVLEMLDTVLEFYPSHGDAARHLQKLLNILVDHENTTIAALENQADWRHHSNFLRNHR